MAYGQCTDICNILDALSCNRLWNNSFVVLVNGMYRQERGSLVCGRTSVQARHHTRPFSNRDHCKCSLSQTNHWLGFYQTHQSKQPKFIMLTNSVMMLLKENITSFQKKVPINGANNGSFSYATIISTMIWLAFALNLIFPVASLMLKHPIWLQMWNCAHLHHQSTFRKLPSFLHIFGYFSKHFNDLNNVALWCS